MNDPRGRAIGVSLCKKVCKNILFFITYSYTPPEAYIGLDLHASTSTFDVIDLAGNQHKRERLPTDPATMSDWLQKLPATRKYLAVEEGPLTQWMGW